MNLRAHLGKWKTFALGLGPSLFLAVLWLAPAAWNEGARVTLGLTAWMACWWISEALPIPVTSLLPLIVLPLFKVQSAKVVAGYYFADLIVLLMGGFLLASMIESAGLHRRIALAVLRRLGTSPRKLSLGFLLASSMLSMWISNTATSLMLLPIALAVIHRLSAAIPAERQGAFQESLLLGIAYGANVGGLGTYLGTPPNLIFRERYEADFVQQGLAPPVSFLQWTLALVPLVMLFLPVIWWVLSHGLRRLRLENLHEVVAEEAQVDTRWSPAELAAALLFSVTALLWITRRPVEIGGWRLFGWGDWVPFVTDATIAITMSLLAFAIRVPAAKTGPGWQALLDWKDAEKRLPWGVLLLFGGGIALGECYQSTGLSVSVGEGLAAAFSDLNRLGAIGSICFLMTFLTEVTSNTATATLLLQVFSAVVPSLPFAPLAVLMPAAIAASCAFMLPVATGPNAIIYGSGRVRITSMVRHGIVLNLIGVVLFALYLHFVALPMLLSW